MAAFAKIELKELPIQIISARVTQRSQIAFAPRIPPVRVAFCNLCSRLWDQKGRSNQAHEDFCEAF